MNDSVINIRETNEKIKKFLSDYPPVLEEKREKGVLISVNPPFSKMIFNGFKQVEFRNTIIKSVVSGTKIYIYETKNKGGCGMILGECTIGLVLSKKEIIDCEVFLGNPKLYRSMIQEECLTKELYLRWQELFEGSEISFQEYIESIGLSGNYAIQFESVVLYEKPVSLSSFDTLKGFVVQRPPQNMMNVYKIIDET